MKQLKHKLMKGFAVGYAIAGITLAVGAGYLATNYILNVLGTSKQATAINETKTRLEELSQQVIANASDLDADGIFESVSSFTKPSNTEDPDKTNNYGTLPSSVGVTTVDNWLQAIRYCPFDHGSAWDDNAYFQGSADPAQSAVVFALISLGPDQKERTNCADAYAKKAYGDDIVKVVTLSEIQKARLRGDTCTDTQISVYNSGSGRFECQDVETADSEVGKIAVCNSINKVFDGTKCVSAGVQSNSNAPTSSATQSYTHFRLGFKPIPDTGHHTLGVDLQDGRLVFTFGDDVYLSIRSRNNKTWLVPRRSDIGKNSYYSGSFPGQLAISSSIQFDGSNKREPELFVINDAKGISNSTFVNITTSKLKRFRLVEQRTQSNAFRNVYEVLGDSDDIIKIRDPLNKEMYREEILISNLGGVSGHAQAIAALDLWEDKVGDVGYNLVAVSNNATNRVGVYKYTQETNLQLLKEYFTTGGSSFLGSSVSNTNMGGALAINNNWLALKSIPTTAGVSTHGKTYMFKFTGQTLPNSPTQTLASEASTPLAVYPKGIKNMEMSRDWLIMGEPSDSTYGTNAGALVTYKLNATSGQWEMKKKIFSPYRSSDTSENTNNMFGKHLDLDNRMLVVSEDGYNSYYIKGNYRNYANGLIYMFMDLGDKWVPTNVYAKHHEPAAGTGSSTLRRWVMGPVSVDGNNGEVAFYMAYDGNINGVRNSDDPATQHFFPASSPNNPFWFLGVYGPFDGFGTVLFNDDMDDNRETCPNPSGPYRGAYAGAEPNSGSVTLSDEFGLTRSVGTCFANYNYHAQIWSESE